MSDQDTTAHKRTASSTSAITAGASPPSKRPAAAPAPAPLRREFPHAVNLILYRDGDDMGSTTTVLGVFAALADANDEVRRLAEEQGAQLDETSNSAIVEPARWEGPDGASFWVEVHGVTPKKIVPRKVEPAGEPVKKLYDAEEGEDPDLDDDDADEGGHYD
ncbi:hypothetical protein CcaCcLH18_04652 [Colletotrichum camelliae]|nr:hypothetical protein CcaCcLH18_04652 [Colletotrichum camelliae]